MCVWWVGITHTHITVQGAPHLVPWVSCDTVGFSLPCDPDGYYQSDPVQNFKELPFFIFFDTNKPAVRQHPCNLFIRICINQFVFVTLHTNYFVQILRNIQSCANYSLNGGLFSLVASESSIIHYISQSLCCIQYENCSFFLTPKCTISAINRLLTR